MSGEVAGANSTAFVWRQIGSVNGPSVVTIGNPSEGALRVSDIRVSDGGDVGFELSAPFAGTFPGPS